MVQDSPEGVIGLNSLVVIPPAPVMLKSVALVTVLAALYGLLIYFTLSTPPKERYNRYVPRLHRLFHMSQNVFPISLASTLQGYHAQACIHVYDSFASTFKTFPASSSGSCLRVQALPGARTTEPAVPGGDAVHGHAIG